MARQPRGEALGHGEDDGPHPECGQRDSRQPPRQTVVERQLRVETAHPAPEQPELHEPRQRRAERGGEEAEDGREADGDRDVHDHRDDGEAHQ